MSEEKAETLKLGTIEHRKASSFIISQQLLIQKQKSDAKKNERAEQRLKCWKDLISVEERVNELLKRMKKNYIKPLRANKGKPKSKSRDQLLISRQHHKLLFRDLETMEKLSTQFLTELKDGDGSDKAERDVNGRVIYTFCPYFVMHKTHIENLEAIVPLLERLMHRDKFYSYVLNKCRHVMEDDIYFLMLRPIDTLLYYRKLVHTIYTNTEEYHQYFQDLKMADASLTELFNSIKKSIPIYQQLLEVSKYDCRFRLGRFNNMDPMKAADIEVLKRGVSVLHMDTEKNGQDESINSTNNTITKENSSNIHNHSEIRIDTSKHSTDIEPVHNNHNTTSTTHNNNNNNTSTNENGASISPRGEILYDTFVKKHRRVIRSGFLLKVGGIVDKDRSYYMILFNDMLIISKVVDESLSEITNKFDPVEKYQEIAEEFRKKGAPKKRQSLGFSNIVGRKTTNRTSRVEQNDVVNGYLRIKQQLPVDACFSASDMFEYTTGYDYYINRYGETCFQIRTSMDSFVAVCKGQIQKQQWLKCFSEACAEYQEMKERHLDETQNRTLIPAPIFQPNDYSTQCTMSDCKTKFRLLNRRYHCLYCGRLACSKCTNYTLPDRLNPVVSVRVCKHCHDQYKDGQSLAITYSPQDVSRPESEIIIEKKQLENLNDDYKEHEKATRSNLFVFGDTNELRIDQLQTDKLMESASGTPTSKDSIETETRGLSLRHPLAWKNLESVFADYCEKQGITIAKNTMISVEHVNEFLNQFLQPVFDELVSKPKANVNITLLEEPNQ